MDIKKSYYKRISLKISHRNLKNKVQDCRIHAVSEIIWKVRSGPKKSFLIHNTDLNRDYKSGEKLTSLPLWNLPIIYCKVGPGT